MKTAAEIHQKAGDEAGYNRFVKMTAAYANRYQMTAGLAESAGSK